MRTLLFVLIVLILLLPSPVLAQEGGPKDNCTTIPSGVLLTSTGDPIPTGYDSWGYNYQAHLFNGMYCGIYHDADWCQSYADVAVVMKWNDAWISNLDCDGDGVLDRHYGFASYVGSGAWQTVHMSSTYELSGKECRWEIFQKIVAVPGGATLVSGVWYAADGSVIGPEVPGWTGQPFALIQDVTNDPCGGVHGLQYVSPDHAGLIGW